MNEYKRLEKDKGIKTLVRIQRTYGCMQQYRSFYEEKRLKQLWENYKDLGEMSIFHRVLNGIESITGFMEDYRNTEKIIIWANHTLGITNEVQLRLALNGFYKLICDYSKEKGRKVFYARKVYWKNHNPIWLGLIDNWREILTDVAKNYFVDFKIDDNKIVEFVVK